jgi:multisubunit Na+/H+ antiporter MnhE subunit
MLHAAAMLAGLFLLGLVATEGWGSREQAALVVAIALASTAAAMRLGGVRKTPFSTAPQFAVLLAGRAGAVMRGAFSTIRAALSADVTLKPALVRARVDDAGAFVKAAAADAITAAPGSIVVESDGDGLLVHVLDEDALDSASFVSVHRRATALLGGGP